MNTNKTNKGIVGFLSFLPTLLLIGQFFVFFAVFFQLFSNNTIHPDTFAVKADLFFSQFMLVLITLALHIVVSLAMLVYFIVHVNNNKSLDSNDRLVWILILVFVGIFAFPVYWYTKIWKEAPPVFTHEF